MANTLPIADKQTLDAVKAILEEQATLINNAFYVPGSTQRLSAPTVKTAYGPSSAPVVKRFFFVKSGEVRISFEAKVSDGSGKSVGFYANDQFIESVSIGGTSYKTYTVDVPVIPGTLDMKTGSGSYECKVYIKDVYVYYDYGYGSTDGYVITD